MDYFLIIFTASVALIGLAASYFDIKKGKIPNKLIGAGFSLVLFLYFSFSVWDVFFVEAPLYSDYFPRAILNGFLSVVAGYAFWKFKFWSAGDGKLFGLYGFLLPLQFYSESYVRYFPSFALLVNLFGVLLIMLFTKFLVYFFRERILIKAFKEFKESKKSYSILFVKSFISQYSRVLLFLISFISLFRIFRNFQIQIDPLIVFFLVFISFIFYGKTVGRNFWIVLFEYFLVGLFFTGLVLAGDFSRVLYFLRLGLFFMVVLVLGRYILFFYVRENETEEVRARKVEEGMILTSRWREYFSRKISELTKNNKHKHFEEVPAEGITAEQARIIRELFDNDPDYKIEICKTISFAPFLLLATTISILTSSSFLPLLNELIHTFV